MKSIILYILLLIPIFSFSQITKTQKDYLKEIINLRTLNNYLKLDTIKLKIKIEDINRKYNFEYIKAKYTTDSLRWAIKKVREENDSLLKLQKQIYNISKDGVILYQRDDNKEDVFYIELKSYDFKMKDNDIIILKPIKDESKWKKIRIYEYPQPDNLSLHLYPHKLNGDKLKKGKK